MKFLCSFTFQQLPGAHSIDHRNDLSFSLLLLPLSHVRSILLAKAAILCCKSLPKQQLAYYQYHVFASFPFGDSIVLIRFRVPLAIFQPKSSDLELHSKECHISITTHSRVSVTMAVEELLTVATVMMLGILYWIGLPIGDIVDSLVSVLVHVVKVSQTPSLLPLCILLTHCRIGSLT